MWKNNISWSSNWEEKVRVSQSRISKRRSEEETHIVWLTPVYYILYTCLQNRNGIFINGIPIDDARELYTANTGYVLQLATPYYEELTVRENLTLAAEIKLPRSMMQKKKFERVEQVMQVVGD